MSTAPLLNPISGGLYAPIWSGIQKQIAGYCDVEFDPIMGTLGIPTSVSLTPGQVSLKNQVVIDSDADFLTREIFVSPISGSNVGVSGAINPQDLKIRITDGDGNAITSDWITANDLNQCVGPCALPFRKGTTVLIDLWNQGDGSLIVQMGFKGVKRFPCNETQARIPRFVTQRSLMCKQWQGVRFEEFEYFFEFGANTSTFATLLLASEGGAIQFTAVTAGAGGNAITVAVVAGGGASPTIGVIGNAITFTQNATNSGTQQQFLALLTGSAAASALVTGVGVNNPNAPMQLQAATNLAGGSGGAASSVFPPWVNNLSPVAPNQVWSRFTLPTESDADFLWRGTCGMIMQTGGPVAAPQQFFLTFYDPNQIPLANTIQRPGQTPVTTGPACELVLSNGGGRMSPQFPEVFVPRSGVLQADLALLVPSDATVQFSLRGVKVYNEGDCKW